MIDKASIIIFLCVIIVGCNIGHNQDSPQDDLYWAMIERAWKANPEINEKREIALSKMDKDLIYNLQRQENKFIEKLEIELRKLDKTELEQFNHFVEEKLTVLNRRDIHYYTDGGDDGFYYARGFILGLGKYYFNKVDRNPKFAVYDAGMEIMCFLGYNIYRDRFKEEFKRYKFDNPEIPFGM